MRLPPWLLPPWRRAARLCLLCSTTLLAGCASSAPARLIPEIRVQPVPIPAPLLSCAPDPAPPGGEAAGDITDRDIAAYMIELWAAGADCRETLEAVRQFQAGMMAGFVNPHGGDVNRPP